MASNNKAVIVTGAASGIGLAITMGLIAAGHDVTAADRNATALKALAARATGLKGSVITIEADLALQDLFALIAGATLVKYGRIDALINNAGIGQASIWGWAVYADPVLGDDARPMVPFHRDQCGCTDRHGARSSAAYAGGEAGPNCDGHDQPRHHGTRGISTLRVVESCCRVCDGRAVSRSRRDWGDLQCARPWRRDEHAAGG